MNRKAILIPAVLLVVLGGIIYWLTTKSRNSTFSAGNTAFAVKDTGAIDEIHLSNFKGQESKLKEQPDNHWKVNGKYRASQSKIQTLLHTIRHVEVKKPVPLESRENVVKSLASENVQVDIYKNGNLVRSYFVGHQTPSELGTYMAMNNADKKPYVTHIPGFYGYLSTRFFADPAKWRSTLIWDFNPVNIETVEVSYPNKDKQPFKLLKKGKDNFQIQDPESKQEISSPNQKAVKRYLTQFRDFHCIKQLNDVAKRDSLKDITPDVHVKVKSSNEKERSLKLYGVFENQPDTTKSPASANNYYGLTPKRSQQVLLIQDRLASPYLKEFTDFESSKIN